MAKPDPFDDHLTGMGKGDVGKAMWGLHEEQGWDVDAMLEEYGFDQLRNADRYKLKHNATEAGSIE